MKKQKTMRSLLLSLISLIMCVTMLVGSTFAWFTDSVTSGSNVIKSGNLDIVMEYWDGNEWVDAEGKVLEFVKADKTAGTEVLWEPGCTYQLPKFRIRNVGNLTAKVLIKLTGVTGNEKLMEVIDLKTTITNTPKSLLEGSQGSVFQRFENATIDIFYGTPDGNIIYDLSVMGAGVVSPSTGHTDTSSEFTITGHMKEEAGNEYQGLTIEGMSITAVATQDTYEYDSFDRNYDKNATFPVVVNTVDELTNVLTNGGNVVLGSDLSVDADTKLTSVAGTKTVLDLNGKTLAFVSDDADANDDGKFTSDDNEIAVDVRGNLTIKNGTVTFKHKSNNLGWNAMTTPFYVTENGTLNVDNATIENLGGSDMAYAIDVVNAINTTVNVTNSTLKSSYIAMRVFNNSNGMNNVTIKNSAIVGTSRAFWVHIYSNKDNGGKGVKDATLNLDIFGNGNTWTANDPNRIIEFGFDEEINFDANGNQLNKK